MLNKLKIAGIIVWAIVTVVLFVGTYTGNVNWTRPDGSPTNLVERVALCASWPVFPVAVLVRGGRFKFTKG